MATRPHVSAAPPPRGGAAVRGGHTASSSLIGSRGCARGGARGGTRGGARGGAPRSVSTAGLESSPLISSDAVGTPVDDPSGGGGALALPLTASSPRALRTVGSSSSLRTTARSGAASTLGSGSAARADAMAAAAAAIAKVQGSAQHKLSKHPHLVRAELEAVRFKHNESLQLKIAFQQRVEERRRRLEAQTGSKAELTRMLSVHAASREDTRRDVLRGAVLVEIDLVHKMKAMGIKSFAGLADAFG